MGLLLRKPQTRLRFSRLNAATAREHAFDPDSVYFQVTYTLRSPVLSKAELL